MSTYQFSNHHQRPFSEDPEVVPSSLPEWVGAGAVVSDQKIPVLESDVESKSYGSSPLPPVATMVAPPKTPIWKRKVFLISAAVGLLAIIGLAVGLGVGLSMKGNSEAGEKSENGGSAGSGAGDTDAATVPSCNGSLCPQVMGVTTYDGAMHVAARTANNTIAIAKRREEGWDDQFDDLGDPGIPFLSQPVAMSWTVAGEIPRLDVFAMVDNEDRTVYNIHHSSAESWADWTESDHEAGTVPRLCRYNWDRLDLWGTRWDTGELTHAWWRQKPDSDTSEGDTSEQGEFSSVENGNEWRTVDDVLVTRRRPGVICRFDEDNSSGDNENPKHDVVWYDSNTGEAQHIRYVGDVDWTPPQRLDGNFIGDPVLVWFPENHQRWDFFGVQEDNRLYHSSWTEDGGGYSAMEDLGGSFISVPTVVSLENGTMDVAALGTDGFLYHQHFDGSDWLDDWENLEVAAYSAPMMANINDWVYIVALRQDGGMLALYKEKEGDTARWKDVLIEEDLGGDWSLEFLTDDS